MDNQRQAIYIGPSRILDWSQVPYTNPVFCEGAGYLEQSHINFGMTGHAWPDEGKWDFRPDGMNVSHMVKRSELFFP